MPSKKQKSDRKKAVTHPGIRAFRQKVRRHYRLDGRQFPWRNTSDPYHIFVSEIMLQQTQTNRVVPKYVAFLERFPSWRHLAKAPLGEVLKLWSGLGYNRRGKQLHDAARRIVNLHKGSLPREKNDLLALPGVGAYTASAIQAFAFGIPSVCIETNIRNVFINAFCKNREQVTDKEIVSLVEQTLPSKKVREWYYALMDLGAFEKRQSKSSIRRSAHYQKQSAFKGSRRQVRGALLRTVISRREINVSAVSVQFQKPRAEIKEIIGELIDEGLLIRRGRKVLLP